MHLLGKISGRDKRVAYDSEGKEGLPVRVKWFRVCGGWGMPRHVIRMWNGHHGYNPKTKYLYSYMTYMITEVRICIC